VPPARLRAAIEGAGFTVSHWADLTDDAAALMRAVLSQPPAPLGLHAFVPGFAAKAANLTKGLASGRLRAIQAVAGGGGGGGGAGGGGGRGGRRGGCWLVGPGDCVVGCGC